MRDDELTAMLREDFETCATQYENDAFSHALRRRLDARMRARKGVLAIAGLLGAGIAAAQFSRLLESTSQSAMLGSLTAQGFQVSSVLTASLIIAAAAVATAIVLQRES